MLKQVEIYTDGACRGNPGPGAWAALLRYGIKEKTISGAERLTTNNRMELMAAIAALATLKYACKIDLTTDSEYLRRGVTEWMQDWKRRGWLTADKKPVKNLDLWLQLEQALERHQIVWHWVKGHSGHKENEYVDRVANQALDQLLSEKA